MPTYRLDIMEQPKDGLPKEHFRQQHEFIASNDTSAIATATKRFGRLVSLTVLERFVLYEGQRLVQDFVKPAPSGTPGPADART